MRVYRRRKSSQYFFPFIILLCLGVLIVLIFQIGSSLFASVKGDAVIYLAEGRAKVLPYGKTEWENTYHGVKVRLGDSVKTLNSSKGVISFYDGTLLRMNEDTQVTLIDITKHGDSQEILLSLNHGEVWVNKPVKNGIVKKTDFVIQTDDATYSITGTIFDLTKTDTTEDLKVMRGEVQADITEVQDGRINIIDTVSTGIGQELTLDKAVMQAFFNRQNPSVLKAIDSKFTSTPWYIWNHSEDDNPTNFASGQYSPPILDTQASLEVNTNSNVNKPNSLNNTTTSSTSVSTSAAPIITNPTSSSVDTINGILTISGTVSVGTKAVRVHQLLSGKSQKEVISLSKFNPNILTFKYHLDPKYNNILPGKNVYQVIAYYINNVPSPVAQITVNFNPNNLHSSTSANSTNTSVNSSNLLNASLKVSTVSGKPYRKGMKLTVDGFLISGIASNATKVFVNDYQLSKFQAGDKTWVYNVKESYGNLKQGINKYNIYAVDGAGKKSADLVLSIDYENPNSTNTIINVASTPNVTTISAP